MTRGIVVMRIIITGSNIVRRTEVAGVRRVREEVEAKMAGPRQLRMGSNGRSFPLQAALVITSREPIVPGIHCGVSVRDEGGVAWTPPLTSSSLREPRAVDGGAVEAIEEGGGTRVGVVVATTTRAIITSEHSFHRNL